MASRIDPQGFEARLREHRGLIVKVAGIYAGSREDRLDLEQEISVQLWRAFASYDERKAKFSTWLYRIALNVAISQVRRRRDDGRVEPLEAHHLAGLASEVPEEPDERLVALYRFIGELDALQRALMLLYLEDRSYPDIADILGISETNVATKINRIKQKLRDRVATQNLEA
ncbi:sigma-70 family RNA polymerase sigma factor [Dyella sp.]|uniref:RNA polymerase sigma factor n=1 Tax=Dyella sp. TaxID=1869338 RepID=UPI002ED314A4